MIRYLTGAALAAALLAPLSVSADGHVEAMEKAVKARQGLFQLYAFNLGQLGAMAKGKAEFNAETAQAAADNLLAAVSMNMGPAWPQGSDNTGPMKGKTRAKPEGWSNYPEVAKKSDALKAAVIELQVNAGTLDGIKSRIGNVGAACKDCHDSFRAKDF